MDKLIITNGRIITPYRIIEHGHVLVEDGIITLVGTGPFKEGGGRIIDAENQYVSPGFIDLHLHGGGGHDFMDNTVEAFLGVAGLHAQHGTTAMVPTTLTAEKEDLLELFSVYRASLPENREGSQFLGLHIEGPYFAMNQKGAQDPRYIRLPDKHEYNHILSQTNDILRWSVAPELEGAMEFAQALISKNILPCIAHSDATSDEVIIALENGFTHLTHFYSAMSGVMRRNAYRHAGIIESGYLFDQLTVEAIADGSHLPASLLQLIYKLKGPSRIALITDSMRAAGMGPGESTLGSLKDGIKVIVEDGVAKLPDRSSFAGSVATADTLVRNMVKLAGVPLTHAIQMMSTTPAQICKLHHRKGRLCPGMDADLVIFDEDISIQSTIIHGNIIVNRL